MIISYSPSDNEIILIKLYDNDTSEFYITKNQLGFKKIHTLKILFVVLLFETVFTSLPICIRQFVLTKAQS